MSTFLSPISFIYKNGHCFFLLFMCVFVYFWFIPNRNCYQTKLGSTHPTCRESELLTPVCGEGNYSLYFKTASVVPSKDNGQLMLKITKFPYGFQGRAFRGNMRNEGCKVVIGWWWGSRVMFGECQLSLSWLQRVWGLTAGDQHKVNFFHLVGF